jgi:hypothetical protein
MEQQELDKEAAQMQKFKRYSPIVGILMLWVFMVAYSCTGVQTVKPYELGKVTAETILFDARVLMNKKVITPVQFDSMLKVYDQLKVAQDIAIDARIAVIKTNSAPDALNKANLAMNNVISLSMRLLTLAESMGIKLPGGQ